MTKSFKPFISGLSSLGPAYAKKKKKNGSNHQETAQGLQICLKDSDSCIFTTNDFIQHRLISVCYIVLFCSLDLLFYFSASVWTFSANRAFAKAASRWCFKRVKIVTTIVYKHRTQSPKF